MLNKKNIAEYHQNGYLDGGEIISSEEADKLSIEIERIIQEYGDSDYKSGGPRRISNLSKIPNENIWQIVNIWESSELFKNLMSNSELCKAASQLLGSEEIQIWHDQVQYKTSGNGGVNMWHQDSPLWGPLLNKNTQVTAWIALDDAAEDNGCMSMVPGSHKWGNEIEYLKTIENFDELPKSFKEQQVKSVIRPVKKGHVHFHHPLVWHGSHKNTSNRPRRAIAFHYMSPETCFQTDAPHTISDAITAKHGEKITGPVFPTL